MAPLLPPLDYLSSESCRQHYLLSRMNRARNLAKELGELLELWVQEAALALLAEWVKTRRYGRLPTIERRAPMQSRALPARAGSGRETHRRPARLRRSSDG